MRRFALVCTLIMAAPLARAGDGAADGFGGFAQYAQDWCERGDAEGCRAAARVQQLGADLATAAPLCAAGDYDACLSAQSARREFWTLYGRLPVRTDMLPGPNGEPPARPIWDQPAADEPPVFNPCDALRPECGFFGDPALGR